MSSRGRAIKARQENQKRLAEKFQLDHSPLSQEELDHIEQVFDTIRRQLDAIGQAGGILCLRLQSF